MSENITKLSDNNFDSLVIIPKKPVVVFFSAEWCGPCRMAKPALEAAAEKYAQKASFYELNVDDNYATAMKYSVNALPVIITFSFGEICGQAVGGINRDKLNQMIEKMVASGEMYKSAMAFSKKLVARYGSRFGA